MTSTSTHPHSPPRKRVKLSLKLLRKEHQPTVEEEQGDPDQAEQTLNNDTANDEQPTFPEPALPQPSSCIPSEYVVTVAPYTGLHNLGNTCYLNSVLQVLRYSPGFAESLQQLSSVVSDALKEKENVDEEDGDSPREDERSRRLRKEFLGQLRLVHKLNKLFEMMSEKEESFIARQMPSGQELAVYPEDILEAIRDLNSMFKGYLQHDAQELLCCILSNVQEACQRLFQQREAASGEVDHLSTRSATAQGCKKAVRKLDMGIDSDDVVMTCGQLLGGGRPSGGTQSSCVRLGFGKNNEGLVVKHLENGRGDAPGGPGSNGVEGDDSIKGSRDKHCHSTRVNKSGDLSEGIAPSSDSVRRRGGPKKSGMTNGHASGKECEGMDSQQVHSKREGGGDCSSSKKKRLGMGRFVKFDRQSSILSKFAIVKRDKCQSSVKEEAPLIDTTQCVKSKEQETEFQTKSERPLDGTPNTTANNSNSTDQSHSVTHDPLDGDVDHGTAAAKEWNIPSEKMQLPGDCAHKVGEISCPKDETDGTVDAFAQGAVGEREIQLVEQMFQGTLVLETRCQECESSSEKREDFQDVSVPVQSFPQVTNEEEDEEEQIPNVNPRNLSLSWALSEFASIERLTDDNKYYCDHCYHHTEAERSVLFGRLPRVLIIQLKRFSAFLNCFSPGGSVTKVNDHLAVPLSLSLTKWCAHSCRQRDSVFELCAVVAHSGVSSSSGHYVAYARVLQFDQDEEPVDHRSSESWANFDDDRVKVMTEEEFYSLLNPLPGNDSAATPYLLFYRRRPIP